MTKSIFWKDVVFPGDVADLRSVGAEGLIVPHGTTLQQPVAPEHGTFRYNTTLGFTELYQNGVWATITTAALGGEINTASNLGAGQPVFAGKVGFDLRFKSLIGGTGVTIGSNANTLTINAVGTGEINTASNIGAGTGEVYESKLGVNLHLRSLRSISPNLSIVNNGSEIDFDITGGVGEVNTGSNLGSGSAVFNSKLGVNFRYRSLVGAGNEIALTQSTNEILIRLSNNPVLPGSASVIIPAGPTVSQPAPLAGMLRYDTTTGLLRAVVGGVWQTVSTAAGTFLPLGGGSMTGNITLTGGADIIGGIGSQITLADSLVMIAGANVDMSAGGDILFQAGSLIDGRDPSVDGLALDHINPTGVFGIVTRTANPDVFAHRSIAGSGSISVVNGNGVAGNPTVSLATNPVITGTGSITIPNGTTAQQPAAPTNGMLRINNTLQSLEFYTGGAWVSALSSNGGTLINGNINMGGFNLTNVNLTDGRDLNVDGLTIDQIVSVANNTGVLVKSAGAVVSRLIQPSTALAQLGATVTNGNGSGPISIGVDINALSPNTGLASADYFMVYDASSLSNQKATMDNILTFVGASGLNAQIDVPNQFGFVTRTANGAVGTFAHRKLVASLIDNRLGVEVLNTDGILGNPTIGLNVTGLPTTTSVVNADHLIVSNGATGANQKVTIETVRQQLLGGAFRATSTNIAVPDGVSVIPLTIGTNDFNPNGYFNDAADSFTPATGWYRIGVYLQSSAATSTGRHVVQVRKNGVAEGNLAVLTADGATIDSCMVEDSFYANGTDVFTAEVNNTTGVASTINAVRFFAHRIY